jgi:c-di-GMP-binding flagellar brake protein YcgR|tara:strand:- start:525 stop:860 length:336 start_codon:yes stop_codon:yes gene_type:complete
MMERRKTPRTSVSFPVECNILPERSYFYTVTKDLSVGGVRIISNKFISKDNVLKLNINFIDKVISMKAKVSWCNENRASDRYLAGLEFLEIGKEPQRYISSCLEEPTITSS